MQPYYGTKRVEAELATKMAMPNADHAEPGYKVRYEDGYESWSPKSVFEAAYQPTDALSFGHAIVALKQGYCVARAGWNGKGMFLYLVRESTFAVNRPPLNELFVEGTVIDYHAHIDMRTAQGYCVPWLASQVDMLADDWQIVINL